jgi:iron complex outermembrane receptor protein
MIMKTKPVLVRRIYTLAALAAAGAASVAPVRGQTSVESAALQEVTVTARKREERLLDVPVAVTAVSAERIEAQSIVSLDDVTYAVPNLSITGGGTDAGGTGNGIIFIRGIGQVDYANSIDPGVGTYIDGVYLGRAVGGNLDLPDVQQIEVLRGPQGTLFGKNTMGGAINVTTKRPSFTNRGSFAVTFGEDDRLDFEAEGDLKLSDAVAARLAAVYRSQDGFVERFYGGDAIGEEETLVVRGKLEFRPSETLSVLFTADYTDVGGSLAKVPRIFDPLLVGDNLGFLWNDVPPAFVADFFDDGIPNGSSPPIPGLPTVPFSVLQGERISPANDRNTLRRTGAAGDRINDYQIWGGALRIEKELGAATLRSITAFRGLDSTVGGDEDGQRANISFALWNDEQEQASQELNLFGTAAEGKLDWLLGAYYFDESADADQTINQNLPWFMVNITFGTDVQSYAGFAEGTWRFNEQWSAVAGLRYTSEDKDFYARNPCSPMMLLAPAICPGGFLIPLTEVSESWSSVDPRVGVQFRPTSDWLLYATYATGFKSGGFNARPGTPAEARQPFDMEELESFEIGAKGSFADGRAVASLAAFTYQYDQLQMVISGLTNTVPRTAISVVGNLGDASVWGFEGELTVRATDRLLLNAAAGYTQAEYDSLDPTVLNLINSSGSRAVSLDNDLPRTPELTANVGIEYIQPLAASSRLSWRVDYAWVDDQFNDVQNFREAMTPAHDNVNARLSYSRGDRWQLALYGKNLTDEEYISNAFWVQGGQGSLIFIVPNEPREIGLSLRVSF